MAWPKKKILEEILPVRIIREVEKWPVLYMRSCAEAPRDNTHFRKKVWNEVAKALIEGWDSYSPTEKECTIMDLKKKWRNLKDTFKRQVSVEKRRRQGQVVKKRKYVYFKHMSFLLPHLEPADAAADDGERPRRAPRASPRAAPPAPPPAPEHVDEDHHFLMSLLPSLRRMSHDDKLSAKMDILKVIKEVRSQAADAPLAVKRELHDAAAPADADSD
ncbi:hypothetical protein PYW07_009278 [Mythimna separata]|uniref:MADF domain-containing protein n=1 Tax=Mythimna separata TaxID=271217 RepID=A0AAD8DN44_MYTSE|nr:hypothetical protein PYW07_009278 [Mythimna separata]